MPFYPQGPDPIYAPVGQVASELKQISVQVTKLEEAVEGQTKKIEGILGHLKMIETRLSTLEDGSAGGDRVPEKKVGGMSRGGSNNHLSLKVSHC